MTIQPWERWTAGAVVAVGLVLAGRAYLDEHDARLKAESQTAVLQKTIDQSQQTINQAKADQAKVDADLKSQLAAIAAQRTIVVTPQQAAVDVSKIIPNLATSPVTVQPVAATPTAPATQQLVVAAADIPAFQQFKLDCDESNAKLNACALTTADQKTRLDATDSQLKATATERDTWEKAARGTFWSRLCHTAKCLGLSAVGGAIGGAVDKANPGIGGAIGAGAGAITCEVIR